MVLVFVVTTLVKKIPELVWHAGRSGTMTIDMQRLIQWTVLPSGL